MAATNQDIKDFFALSGNNPAVTNGQLATLAEWFTSITSIASPDADDFVDYLYDTLRQQVVAYTRTNTSINWE